MLALPSPEGTDDDASQPEAPDEAPSAELAPDVGAAVPVHAPRPADMGAIADRIGRGLAPDATPEQRAEALQLWTLSAPFIHAAARSMSGPVPIAAPSMVANLPAPSQLSFDQLIAIAIEKMRARLPPGTTVTAPRGFQVQLVPPFLK